MKRRAIDGLYAITPDELDTAELLRKSRAALQGGAQVLQYRNKLASAGLRFDQAQALRRLTREYGAIFIVNDEAALALESDADGVHLGADDGGISATRSLLGKGRLIGASCYNRASLAIEAVQQGADYVAFGAFFPSSIKPGAVKAEIDMLRRVRCEITVPIVAIGGITVQNGAALVEAGADALAVISGLWNAPDIEQAARGFSNLFQQGRPA